MRHERSMKSGILAGISLLCVLLGAGCSGGGGKGSSLMAALGIGGGGTTTQQALVQSAVGGVITDPESGASVSIPEYALSTDTTISLTAYKDPAALQSRFGPTPFVGGVELGPDGTQFDSPVTVTIPSGRTLIPGARYPLFLYDEAEERWEETEFTGVASEDGSFITAEVTHFSTYACFGSYVPEGVAEGDIFYRYLDAFGRVLQAKNEDGAAALDFYADWFMNDATKLMGHIFDMKTTNSTRYYQVTGMRFDLMYDLNGAGPPDPPDEHREFGAVPASGGLQTTLSYAYDYMNAAGDQVIFVLQIAIYYTLVLEEMDSTLWVGILTPQHTSTVRDLVTVATGATKTERVEFYVDGALKYNDTVPPFGWEWDTTGYADGNHTIRARAYDDASNSIDSDTITVTVANTTTPAGISFTDTDGDTGQVGGLVTIQRASDEGAITSYALYWGKDRLSRMGGQAVIATIAKTGANVTHTIPANTAIPSGAKYLLAYAKTAAGEGNLPVSCLINDMKEKNWVQDAYLKASNADMNDLFGYVVAVSGDTIIASAWGEDSSQSYITNSDGDASSENSAINSGAVYVFKKDASGNWIQDAYLKASNAEGWEQFGYSIAISGNTIAVGVPTEDSNQTYITNIDGLASPNNSASSSGAVYIFKKDALGNWIQDAYLKASNAEILDAMGHAIAMSGETIVVPAGSDDANQTFITNNDGIASSDNNAPESGAVFVFKKDASGNWIQDAYLKPSNSESNDGFGLSVAVSGNYIVVGTSREDSNQSFITNDDGIASADNSAVHSGAVYVFKRDASGNWIQDAYLKASNREATDLFGTTVAISGKIIVVGAIQEDSNQTTITNGDGLASSNNGMSNSGAVYVFKRDASDNWIQDAYLKASNTDVDDEFGTSISISGDIIVVGADCEDGDQTFITNDDGVSSANNDAPQSGAAYVFKKDMAGNWIQDAYLKASNSEGYDYFGLSVSVSGNTIVVGARAEDSSQNYITNDDGVASSDNSLGASGAVYVFKR